MSEPFDSILDPPMPPTMESLRIRRMGSYVSAGGGGFIVMMPKWESQDMETITWEMRYDLWKVTRDVRSFLANLTVDVEIDHARFIKSQFPEYRIYWIDPQQEVTL